MGFAAALILLAVCLGSSFGLAQAQPQNARRNHWVTTWASAQQGPEVDLGIRAETFADQSIRMVVRSTMAGTAVRVLFSNALSANPLEIGAAHIGLAGKGCSIIPGSDRILTFGGRPSITIPPGAPALSDSVHLKVSALGELAISLFVPHPSTFDTFHFLAQHPTCVSASGNHTREYQWPGGAQKPSWYWLSAVEVRAPAHSSAIAALGDSITDGFGAKGQYRDWPDLLASRLASGGRFAVINEGIGGNRLLHDGDGPSALARLDRDVLSKPDVRNLIVLGGINDIGWPAMEVPIQAPAGTVRRRPFRDQEVTAGDVTQALQQIIDRAHERGIRVFGCTLTPYRGSFFYTPKGDAVREAINQWIRTSHAFDGVFDFDKAVRDPSQPERFLPRYQSGDWLHPSNAGYAAMVNMINPALFSSAGRGVVGRDGSALHPSPNRLPSQRVSQ